MQPAASGSSAGSHGSGGGSSGSSPWVVAAAVPPAILQPLMRGNTSDGAAAAVRAMIVDGRMAGGARINEVHLARSLGVSRTPLREALNRLAAEGALVSTPRHGFSVRPLTLDDFEQVYAIRPLLDPEALRLAGLPTRPQLVRLRDLNAELAAARDADTAIAVDDRWHFELIAGCPNRVLLELIEKITARTRRYEIALMRETRNILRATADHERVLQALRAGKLGAACTALKANLQSGRAPIVAWLTAREAKKPARP